VKNTKEITIKISSTTYKKILAIKKRTKLGATIKSIVDYAVENIKIK